MGRLDEYPPGTPSTIPCLLVETALLGMLSSLSLNRSIVSAVMFPFALTALFVLHSSPMMMNFNARPLDYAKPVHSMIVKPFASAECHVHFGNFVFNNAHSPLLTWRSRRRGPDSPVFVIQLYGNR